jgi:hypothetical protein
MDVASRATTGHYALVVNPEMRILGVHPVDGVDGCFLIESIITDATAQPDFGQMTQTRQDAINRTGKSRTTRSCWTMTANR